jgi:hypothetical protein
LGGFVPGFVSKVIAWLLARFEELRDRRASRSRLRRANQGVAFVLVVGVLLGLGVLAAVTLTQTGAATFYLTSSSAASPAASAPSSSDVSTVTVTKTTRRGDRHAVRKVVVRTVTDADGSTSGFVTLPSNTIFQTRTVTTREVATVTDVEEETVTAPPETVTVIETVTCRKHGC